MTYVTLAVRRAVGDDTSVALGFGAVFRPVRAIIPGDQHQTLTVQAKTVVAVVVDAAIALGAATSRCAKPRMMGLTGSARPAVGGVGNRQIRPP